MKLPWNALRLFRMAVHGWLVLYVVTALPAAGWLWEHPISPMLQGPPGPFRYLTHAFATWLPAAFAIPAVVLLVVLAIWAVLRPVHWSVSLVIWMLFTSAMNHAWLAASGGHQLMANVLFWMIFLPCSGSAMSAGVRGELREILGFAAFWIIRLQLLLAYGVTGIQKLTGYQWTHGHAIGIVATDPDYGPAFLAGQGALLTVLTYMVLGFQLLFPVAVWWRPSRILWMWAGLVFHVCTGLAFGILDMAFAFLVIYPIWWSDKDAMTWSMKLGSRGVRG